MRLKYDIKNIKTANMVSWGSNGKKNKDESFSFKHDEDLINK